MTAVPPTKGRLKLIDMNTMEERVWEDIDLAEDLGELVFPNGPKFVGRLPPSTDPEDVYVCVETIDGCFTSDDLIVGEDHEFQVDCLRANTAANVYIVASGRAAFVLRDAVLAPGETRDLGVIAFPEGVALEGRVLISSIGMGIYFV